VAVRERVLDIFANLLTLSVDSVDYHLQLCSLPDWSPFISILNEAAETELRFSPSAATTARILAAISIPKSAHRTMCTPELVLALLSAIKVLLAHISLLSGEVRTSAVQYLQDATRTCANLCMCPRSRPFLKGINVNELALALYNLNHAALTFEATRLVVYGGDLRSSVHRICPLLNSTYPINEDSIYSAVIPGSAVIKAATPITQAWASLRGVSIERIVSETESRRIHTLDSLRLRVVAGCHGVLAGLQDQLLLLQYTLWHVLPSRGLPAAG
jgi:hypothetical protein